MRWRPEQGSDRDTHTHNSGTPSCKKNQVGKKEMNGGVGIEFLLLERVSKSALKSIQRNEAKRTDDLTGRILQNANLE